MSAGRLAHGGSRRPALDGGGAPVHARAPLLAAGGDMKRRSFCAAGLAALAATSIPYRRVWGAAETDIEAAGLDGHHLTLKSSEVAQLRAGLRGELLTSTDAAYEGARRLWNPAFERHPALIARCVG